MKYVYVDECSYSFSGEEYIGTGILVSDLPIGDEIIDRALENLRNDPDISSAADCVKKMNDATLEHGYFHACEDSKDAHSHFLNEVNAVQKNQFICDFNKKTEKKDSFLFDKSFYNALCSILGKEEMVFYVEQRGSLSENKLVNMYNEFVDYVLTLGYEQTWNPIFLPKAEFHIVDKRCAGVQCCDFLLWAVERSLQGNSTWLDRIKLVVKSDAKMEGGGWQSQEMIFDAKFLSHEFYYDISDCPNKKLKELRVNEVYRLLVFVLKTCCDCLTNVPKEILFMEDELRYIKENMYSIGSEDFDYRMFKCFARIFDLIDVVKKDMPSEEKKNCLMAKKMSAYVLASKGSCDSLRNLREQNISNLEDSIKNFLW